MKLPKRGRVTAKHSIEALRQSWLTVDVNNPRLTPVGRQLALSARNGTKNFQQVCHELRPELKNKQTMEQKDHSYGS
jgi:hypothetical protein